MSHSEVMEKLNLSAPYFIKMLGGTIVAINPDEKTCTFEFNIGTDFCHSVDIVQGGFVTAMLDVAMSHAAFALGDNIVGVSSLEISTSYLEPTRAGRLTAVGSIIKSGYKTAFMEGRLYNEDGLLNATTSTVAKLIRDKPVT